MKPGENAPELGCAAPLWVPGTSSYCLQFIMKLPLAERESRNGVVESRHGQSRDISGKWTAALLPPRREGIARHGLGHQIPRLDPSSFGSM